MSGTLDFPRLREELETLPPDEPVVLLLRHADRPELPPGQVGDDVGLTPLGEERSRALGALLGGRIAAVRTSPIPRCRRTAELILAGAAYEREVVPDPLLGDPGCFIHDPTLAWQSFLQRGTEGVVRAQLGQQEPLPGFRPTAEGVALLRGALPGPGDPPGIHVWVTHDTVLAIVMAHQVGRTDLSCWPGFLDHTWLRREG